MGPVGGFEDGELVGGEERGFLRGCVFWGRRLRVGQDVVCEEEGGEVAELAEGFDAGLDEGGDFAEVVVGEDGGAEGGVEGSGVRARRYSPLSHLSLVRSKTGPPRRMLWTVEVLDHLVEGEDFVFFGAVDDFDGGGRACRRP